MPLSEGVQARLIIKPYASGAMVSNAEPLTSSEPGATGGRVLRRTTHSLNLRKNTYRSGEVRQDRQVGDFRHGSRRVEGSINGEFSPATYFDVIEAVHRHTKVASVTDSNTEFTSCAADNPTSRFTFAGGDPVTEGYRIGDVIRFTNLTDASNNNRNFLITGIGGASNRELTVFPAPATMAADTTFSVTRPGVATSIPATGHVSRRFAIEDYDEATDISRLFKELRASGYRIGLPAEGMATFEAMFMGRGMDVLTGASAPYFTAPAVQTTTGIAAAVNGLITVNGVRQGVITGLTISNVMEASAPGVVGQLFTPEVFLGTNDVTGEVTALLEDGALINNFAAEDEIAILALVTTSNAAAADACAIYLPRIKFTAADLDRSGDAEQPLTLPFQALRYLGAAPGIESTTIRVHDTAAT
jgi:hypothetical protein